MVFITTIKRRADLQGSEVQLKRPINKWKEVSFLDSGESTLQKDPLKAVWKLYFLLCKGEFV